MKTLSARLRLVTRSLRSSPPIRRSLAATLVIAAVTGLAFGAAPETTLAAWNEVEYVSARFGTLDCAAPAGRFDTRAQGRVLSGTLLTWDLAGVAELKGVTAMQTAGGVTVDPAPPESLSLGAGAYSDPLTVTALGSVYASLGSTLRLPLGAQAGALNSYAKVSDTGVSIGAAGLVDDSGAIAAAQAPIGSNPPEIAEIRLGQIVAQTLGRPLSSQVGQLTDARLRIGDVASRSTLDACSSFWGDDVYSKLARDYYIAGLRLDIDAPAVGTLTTATSAVVAGVDARAEALRTNTAFLTAVRQGLLDTLGGALGTLGLGEVTISSLDLRLDLSAVNGLLDARITDPSGIVAVDLASGTVTVDIASLVGAVYGTSGLNGLPPNTQVLIDNEIVTRLELALTQALSTWATSVTSAVTAALDAAVVSASVNVRLNAQGLPLADVGLGLVDVPLGTLLAGGAVATSNVRLLGAACTTLNPLACTLNGLVDTLTPTLRTVIGGVLGRALSTALTGSGGLIAAVGAEVRTLTGPLVAALSAGTRGLLGQGGLLYLGINAQNAPAPAAGATGAEPTTWSIPAPMSPRETRRFDVAAIRVVGVGALATGLSLDFARSSAGGNLIR